MDFQGIGLWGGIPAKELPETTFFPREISKKGWVNQGWPGLFGIGLIWKENPFGNNYWGWVQGPTLIAQRGKGWKLNFLIWGLFYHGGKNSRKFNSKFLKTKIPYLIVAFIGLVDIGS